MFLSLLFYNCSNNSAVSTKVPKIVSTIFDREVLDVQIPSSIQIIYDIGVCLSSIFNTVFRKILYINA